MSNSNQKTMESKRFLIRKSLIGTNTIIKVTFKSGKQYEYNHDAAYELMKDKLDTMPCFIKYKSYTSSTSIPTVLRDKSVSLYLGTPHSNVRSRALQKEYV